MFFRSVSCLALSCALAAPAFAADVEAAEGTDQSITVTGQRDSYRTQSTSTATRTPTDLNDIPQAISIVSEQQIDDQALRSVSDVLRYVPGVSISAGEGHRDQIVFRGNNSTADFFVDGLRDDVQYYRGLYNVERIEVLKGPNAMIFGRGGGGGIVNRVTKRPGTDPLVAGSASVDNWGAWFVDGDVNQPLGANVSARLNAVYEEFNNHRDYYDGYRIGVNPTLAFTFGDTRIDLGYEYDRDRRVIDRGVPSARVGTIIDPAPPLSGYRRTFFGDPDVNLSDFEAHVLTGRVEHRFSDSLTFTSRALYGDYEKLYQNAFAATPPALMGGVQKVGIEAYKDPTKRKNFFSQNDLVWQAQTGPLKHVVLAGVEFGDQRTRNQRLNGFFDSGVPSVNGGRRTFVNLGRRIAVPPITFRNGTGFRSIRTNADVLGIYLQDQISIGEHFDIIAGIRHDRFKLEVDDLVAGKTFSRTDNLWSPRFGLVLKPMEPLSVYASYSRSYLPQSGDQFSSLDVTTSALEPEEFENIELGLKWDIRPTLNLTAAIYQLDRTNTRATDPVTNLTVLTGGQRSKGFELGLTGEISRNWHVSAGYSLQDAEIRRTTTAAPAGRKVALVPRHQASLWTRYDFTPSIGAGLGVYHQSRSFASISNAVVVPAFTRVDAAAFFRLTDQIEVQVNVENLFGEKYFTGFNDNNIIPAAPTTVRGTLKFKL